MPLLPSESVAETGLSLPFVLLSLMLFTGWLASLWLSRRWRLTLGWTGWAMVAFLAAQVASAVVMGPQGELRAARNMAWTHVGLGLLMILGLNVLDSPAERRAAAATMLTLAVCLAALGIYQNQIGFPKSRAEYERNPAGVLMELGINAPPGSPARQQFEDRLRSSEPYATFSLTNSLAGFLAPWIIVLLAIGLRPGMHLARPNVLRRTLLATGFVLALCLLLTKSRTAWLATACGVGLLVVYGRRSGWRPNWRLLAALAGGSGLLLCAVAIWGGLDWLVLSETSKSASYRLQYWHATLAMIADHPWLGVGPGNFQSYYSQYKLPQASEMIADPHNFVLELWATSGLVGLLPFVAILASLLRRGEPSAAREPLPALEGVPKPASTSTEFRSVRHVYLGALVGLVMAYPLGILVGFMPDPILLALGLPLAASVLWGLRDWVARGELPAFAPAIGLVVLLINLSAAGAIGFPGIAQSVWMLIVLVLGSEARATETRATQTQATLWRGAIVLVSLAATVWFWRGTWEREEDSRAALDRAAIPLATGRYREAIDWLEQAAEADPLAAEPHFRLAALHHQGWLATDNENHRRLFERHLASLLERSRRAYQFRMHAGNWYLSAHRRQNDPELLRRAIAFYDEAIALYPNSNMLQAQLAWACFLATDDDALRERTRSAMRAAWQLDELCPHAEQKLERREIVDIAADELAPGQPKPPSLRASEVLEYLRAELSR